jgi:hypothetical protein
MTIEAQRTRTRQPDPVNASDRDAVRLLALLEANSGDALTIADMRERGIAAPGQVIYALQLAGYDIDRAPIEMNSGGPRGYRLRSDIPHVDGRADAADAGAVDER